MKHGSSPMRKAINQHLHRKHGQFAGTGSTENRIIQHEILHAQTDCDHTHEADDDDFSNFTERVGAVSPKKEGSRDRSNFIGR